ncbi:dihydrolipoamide acetyltransferase family protein [Arthrobacter agilis]|uniref:dihydrolipoamide acetyltransferase family protein n=1 Tax=Arthrobacter agilis TaxID=37921 RepID=UPI0027805F04|nr:dihydrolipoamide acetyltransferase family protein [Arthrobacter agilis]MDQ0735977.1 2-oxoisovalerate dehydrogenase E2 component (dihydrolipoyl transacylase) [Arthrobacter agilis]
MSAPTIGSGLVVFALPDLGEGLTEAELVSWLVAEGDAVAVDQPIAEVETAKSVVEVPSPFAGTVAVLHGRPGEVLDVGAPFLSVRPEGTVAATLEGGAATGPVSRSASGPAGRPSAGAPAAPAAGNAPAVADAASAMREDSGVPVAATHPDGEPTANEGSGNVLIGYGTPGGLTGGRRRPRRTSSRSGGTPPAGAVGAPATAAASGPSSSAPAGVDRTAVAAPLCVSPLVRKLARDHGLRLEGLRGSGEKGLILRRDVEQAIAALSHVGDAARPVVERAAASRADGVETVAAADSRSGLTVLERIPVRGVRRTIAEAMSRSRREIPEATVWVDVDVTALVELREGMKRKTPDAVPGILSFVARFVVAGLARYPELNSRVATLDDGSLEIVRVEGVNLGIAAQTDRGLVVPGVRRADTMSARELDAEIRRLAALARSGKATPADLSSGTFTLNNYGVFGVDGSAAIINYPESAILGMGRIIDRPWVVDGQLAVRKVTELTLAFDHRVCDGGTAGGFLRFVADAMENPGAMLADL